MHFAKLIKAGVGVSSLTIGGTYLAFNSLFIEYHKNAVEPYQRGARKTLNAKLEKLCYEVLDEIKLSPEVSSKCKFFNAVGLDMYNIGSLHFGQLAYIGLPDHFEYTSVEDINHLTVFKQPVKLQTVSGRKLREALVLSENAKKFAIARDVYFCDSYRIYLKSLLLSTSILVPHLLYYIVKRRFSAKPLFQPKSVRASAYMVCALFGFIFYGVTVDLLNQYYEKISDRRAILLNSESGDYFEGALEYYGKMLQRNKALRKMMGDQGSKYFTKEGNEVVYMRRIHLPLTTRISEIEEFRNPFSSRQ